MIGYIGTVFLIVAFLLLGTKWDRWFLPINLVCCVMFFTHAYKIGDLAFTILQGCMFFILGKKFYNYIKEGKWNQTTN